MGLKNMSTFPSKGGVGPVRGFPGTRNVLKLPKGVTVHISPRGGVGPEKHRDTTVHISPRGGVGPENTEMTRSTFSLEGARGRGAEAASQSACLYYQRPGAAYRRIPVDAHPVQQAREQALRPRPSRHASTTSPQRDTPTTRIDDFRHQPLPHKKQVRTAHVSYRNLTSLIGRSSMGC